MRIGVDSRPHQAWHHRPRVERTWETLSDRLCSNITVDKTTPVAAPLTVPIYVVLGRTDEPVKSFTWRIWDSRTSFYLKSRAPGLGHLKLSLHGDDPRHPAGGGFKMAMDTEEAFAQAIQDGRLKAERYGDWPLWFPGRQLNPNAKLAVRMRWTWDAATRLGPGPPPGNLKRGAVGLTIPPPPEPGDAVDVDLVVSSTRPFWPQEQKARIDNACLGPLRNESGDWLTGTVVKRSIALFPTPAGAIGPRPKNRLDELRAVGAATDDDGVLWLVEQRMSESELGGQSAS